MPKKDIHGDKVVQYDHQGFKAKPVEEEHGGHEIEETDSSIITKGGFYKLELDVDDAILTDLVDLWARKHLQPASLELFLENTDDQSKALHDAVLNDSIIDILKSKIAEAEAEADADLDAGSCADI